MPSTSFDLGVGVLWVQILLWASDFFQHLFCIYLEGMSELTSLMMNRMILNKIHVVVKLNTK